jgi:hypothetical protein
MKSEFIQIRVSGEEKSRLVQQASRAGMDLSSYLLAAVSRNVGEKFLAIVDSLRTSQRSQLELAELNDLLSAMSGDELTTLPKPVFAGLSDFLCNYIAGSVEFAAGRVRASAPGWTRDVPPLGEPVFASTLLSLRPYLLRVSPPPFKSRNIFVDSTIGSRV